jgi:hypothetical protein
VAGATSSADGGAQTHSYVSAVTLVMIIMVLLARLHSSSGSPDQRQPWRFGVVDRRPSHWHVPNSRAGGSVVCRSHSISPHRRRSRRRCNSASLRAAADIVVLASSQRALVVADGRQPHAALMRAPSRHRRAQRRLHTCFSRPEEGRWSGAHVAHASGCSRPIAGPACHARERECAVERGQQSDESHVV